METFTIPEQPPPTDPVSHAQIRWASLPVDPLEEFHDPLAMSDRELLAYCTSLQCETRWVRRLLHEALSRLARLTDDLRRATRLVEWLRQELAAARPRGTA